MMLRKDSALDELAQAGNVAQFVSFEPTESGPRQTFSRVFGHEPNHLFPSPAIAVRQLLAASPDASVNLRSFTPDSPRSREFVYGVTDASVVLDHLLRLTADGLYVIVNETVDVSDGGVSGVIEANVLEFAPDDTPRCVEKPGTVALALQDGLNLLAVVYGLDLSLPKTRGQRIELSIHPTPRGFKRTHTLLWEKEQVQTRIIEPDLRWPNRFSRVIGDKAFGLLVAHLMGAPVPLTTVISRRLKPFVFGTDTGSPDGWLRTCPTEQDPGRYTTVKGWIDPFRLMADEDPTHEVIASVISQQAVPAGYSGAAITKKDGRLHIEGTYGEGDSLMLGRTAPMSLPQQVVSDVTGLNKMLRRRLGAVRFEWVHDGVRPWVVQLHKGSTSSTRTILVPGEPQEWARFDSRNGLEELRQFLAALESSIGLELVGEVGLTSHVADLARKSGRPTRIVRTMNFHPAQLELAGL